MDAVIAGERGQAEIGNDEPLGGELAVIVGIGGRPLRRRGHHIDAGLQIAEHLIDRERGGDVGIQRRGRGVELARPHLGAALVAEVAELVAVQRALEVAVDHGVDQVAVADPEHLHRHGRGVDADQRNAALAGARQHIGAAGEADQRLAVADIDVELGRLRQRLLHGRRQAGAQIDVVALAVLQPLDAELAVLGADRRLVGAGQRHIGRKIGALGQFLGELEAHPRRGRIRIDGVIEQPEAVIGAQLLILAADVGDLAQLQRNPQGIERRPPQAAVGHRAAEQRQRGGLLARALGALIGDIGGGGGAFAQEGLFGTGGGLDLQHGAGQPLPIVAVGRIERRDLSQNLQAAAVIAALERGVGVAAQHRGRFVGGRRLALDLGFELDRGVRQLVALERLVGRLSRCEPERQSGAKREGANQTDHA